MKLQYAVMGSDVNPLYLDFWEPVSKVWNISIEVTPVLGIIDDEETDFFESKFGLVKKFKKIEGISSIFQSQIVRIFLPSLLKGNCIVSDIDMMPISKKYFEESTNALNDKNFIVLSSDCPNALQNDEYPMCYLAGSSAIFDEIFVGGLDWVSFCKKVFGLYNDIWTADQKYVFDRVNKYHKLSNLCVFLQRGWHGLANNRIDRSSWEYDILSLKTGYYYDSHLLRPYQTYKDEIDKLTSLILEIGKV